MKTNGYKKILNYYFENNGLILAERDLDDIILKLKHTNECVYKSCKEECNYYIIKAKSENITVSKAVNCLPENFDPNKYSKILFIVKNIQDKFNINKPQYKKEFKIALTKKLSLNKPINTIYDISSEFVGTSRKKHVIEIKNRVDSLHYNLLGETEENASVPRGDVYIASLYDIVNMYSLIGDTLFDLNVRYQISDELDVEKEIRKTIDETPDHFWFYNNGITIISNNGDFVCDTPTTISFSNNGDFSVINGAQTITTATKWYSENKDKKDKLNKVWVILRVVLVEDIYNSFAKNVSISLNRQKSITEVDIATTYPFVKDINMMMNQCYEDNICFELNKRGGTPTYKYSYYIDDFAQLVETYLIQKPGSARSSKGSLIGVKEKNGEYSFVRKDIFKNIKSTNDIKKYYAPVNYSYELACSYKSIPRNSVGNDPASEILLKYGNMYCIASVVYCINKQGTDDFSNFTYIDKKYNIDIIQKFISLFKTFLTESKNTAIDSNDFKKEVLYEGFKESEYMTSLFQYIENIKDSQ